MRTLVFDRVFVKVVLLKRTGGMDGMGFSTEVMVMGKRRSGREECGEGRARPQAELVVL